MRYSILRNAAGSIAFGAILAGCTAKGESGIADSATPTDESSSPQPVATQSSPSAGTAATYPGPDQMPSTAKLTVTGSPPNDGWNGSWTVNSNVSGCGINTYPKMINFDIIDENPAAGGFREVRIGSNDGPDVGGTTSKFSLSLDLDRRVPNLSITPENNKEHSGTLTIIENAKGSSRFKVTARDSRGIQFDGEFTCVPRPPAG